MTYYRIKNELHLVEGGSWQQRAEDLIASVARKPYTVLRLIFFSDFKHNEDYLSQRKYLEQVTEKYFPSPRPLLSLIAQKPLVGDLLLEVHSLPEEIRVREMPTSFGHYLRIETEDYREILGGGLCADDLNLPIRQQSEITFKRMEEILKAENLTFGHIVRQWNYLEHITGFAHGNQCYQDFNDIRSQFYTSSEWPSGYPAATGIGTRYGGVQIDFNALQGAVGITPLDNDWQKAAHAYSEDVLISNRELEKETPKFERGKLLTDYKQKMIYISGTAAIRGEDSIVEGGILPQTDITLENIQHLVQIEEGIDQLPRQSAKLKLLRVYLKNEADVFAVREKMEYLCPQTPIAYLHADICRSELLIEIEGVACL